MFILWMILAVALQKPMTEPLPGMWAAGAAYLWPGPTAIADYPAGGVAIDVPSPDGSMVLSLRDTALRVDRTGGTRTSIEVPLPVDAPAEVLWAPDSRAFTLTWTDGGWVGTWHVALYRVADASVELVDVAGEAFKAFSQRSVTHRRDCDVEAPNMGVAAWLNGGHHLLVLAEVPPHGSACDMGRIHGYTVDVGTGQIMAQYTEADIKRLFLKRLGTRFH